MVLQETRNVVWSHVNVTLGSCGNVSVLAAPGMVCLFLVTISGLMSFDFAVETFSLLHEFCFLGFRMLLASSQSIGVDVHSVSALGSSASSRVVSSSTVIFS